MTDQSRKVQIGTEVDATGVRKGVDEVKQSLGEIGTAGQRAGEQASQGLGKIGDGSDKAAQKVERDTKSLIGSIERATAAFKAGQRGSAGYFEELAKQRGVSGDAIKPYVDQLRAAEAAQKAATQSLGGMQVSAAQTSAALRQLPAQFTDIVTSLQGGQAPLTVLLQQGGQIKDSFGGAGAAAKALGGYILSLVGPFTVAAAAAGALAFAYVKGAEEGQAFNRTLILTGNQVGATAEQLSRAAAGAKALGVTQGAAADAINQLAASGRVGAENLGRFAAAAVRLEQVGGPAVESTVNAFAELGKSPLQAALKLNETTNFLTASVYEQIKALEQQGRTTEAAKVAQDAFAASAEQRIPQLTANLGDLERAWLGVKKAVNDAGNAVLEVGRPQTIVALQKQLADAEARLSSYGGRRLEREQQAVEKLRTQILLQADLEEKQQISAQQDADRARQLAALAEFDRLALSNLDDQAKLKLEIQRIEQLGLAAGKDRVDIERQIAAARQKLDKPSGADNELASIKAKTVAAEQYRRALLAQGVQAKELTDGEKVAAQIREQLNGKLSAAERATKQLALAEAEKLGSIEKGNAALKKQADLVEQDRQTVLKQADGARQQASAIEEQARAQEAANAAFGLGKVAIEQMRLANLERQREELADVTTVSPQYLAALQEKIDAQERYVAALKAADFKQLNQGLDEWLRSATEQRNLFEDEQQLAGLTRLEREKILAARQVELKLAKQLADIGNSTASDDEKDLLRIKARQAAEIESSAAVAKVVRDDWAKTADSIESSITDALLRGFESGKGFAQNLRDTVVNMFKTLVLRPVISAVVQPYAGQLSSAVNGLLNPATSAGGLGSLIGIGNLISSLNGGLGSLGLSAVNSSLGQLLGLSSTQNIAGNLITGPTGAGSFLLNNGGSILGYGNALYGLSKGAYGSAAGSALGTYFGGPVGAAIGSAIGGALDKAFGSAGTPHSGAGFVSNGTTGFDVKNGQYGLGGAQGDSTGRYYNQGVEDALKSITGGAASVLNNLSQAFGGGANFQVGGYFASDNNRGSNFGRSVLLNGQVISEAHGNNLDKDPTKGLQQLADDLANQVKSALTRVDLPGWARDQVAALGSDVSFDQLNQVAAAIIATQQALKDLGAVMPQLGSLTDDATTALLKSFDGIQNLQAAASSYYDNFYSDAQKTANATKQLGDALAALGFETPKTREAYRALVEEQKLNTEAGQATYAALIKLSPAFAALVPATEELGETAEETAKKMAEAGQKILADLAQRQGGLQVELMRAQGDAGAAAVLERQQALAKLTQGLSEQDAAAATAAYDFNAALQAQIDTLKTAATAAQQAATAEQQRVAAIGAERYNLETQLLQAQGNVAALRERELAALNESNRAIQQQIYDIEDLQQAQQAAAQEAQQAAAAAEQLRQAWQGTADGIFDEVRRIRGLAGSSPQSFAAAQSQFAIATAQARAGDQEAAKLLPSLSQALLSLGQAQIASALDLKLLRAQTAASLSTTAQQLAANFGLSVPRLATGTNEVPQDMLAVIHKGEAVVPRAFNPAAGGRAVDDRLLTELKGLREDQRVQATVMVRVQRDLLKLQKKWDLNGTPANRNEGTPA